MNNRTGAARLILIAVIVLLILFIGTLMILKQNGKPPRRIPEKAMPVSILNVQPTNMADMVYLPALIEANVDATLSAEKAGRVVDIMADRGDQVKRGELLLQIDDRIWKTSLKQYTIAADDAEKNFKRMQTLKESGAISQSEYDSSEKAYIQASSMAEEALINIEQCRVESPVDGIVNDRLVETGEYVQPGTPLFQVIDKATLRVVLPIPERDVYAVQPGDRISFSVQPLPGRSFEGVVTFIAAQADGRNNAFRTEITVDNAEGLLRPGMIAQVEFHRGTNEDIVALPMSAVLPSKGEHIVYLMQNGQAVRRKVQIESITRRHALISSGLESGDVVIMEGNRTLSDGQRVEVIEPESAQQ